jgi:hypothetical protein
MTKHILPDGENAFALLAIDAGHELRAVLLKEIGNNNFISSRSLTFQFSI